MDGRLPGMSWRVLFVRNSHYQKAYQKSSQLTSGRYQVADGYSFRPSPRTNHRDTERILLLLLSVRCVSLWLALLRFSSRPAPEVGKIGKVLMRDNTAAGNP